MGGRAAEEITFSLKTAAAQGDIVQATEIAINMICKRVLRILSVPS
jgi:ATP-dependent Zn protease